jgi:myo-inositol-1(or 4)-monophosphatase
VTRPDLPALLEIAREAVSAAARDLRTCAVSQVTVKGDRDVVTDLDIAVERRTRGFLHERTPAIGFLGEEEGGDTGPGLRWILDPVDGTANLIRGLPLTGISLALADGAQALLGVISLPLLGRTYWAGDGLGAWRDGQPARVSAARSLPEAMIAVGDYGTGPDAAERNQAALAIHAGLAPRAQKVRMLGSAAVDLALVADGTLDASLTLGNRPWDMAAGVVIARAAGAIIMDADGSPYTLGSLATIAAAPGLAGPVLGIVRAATAATRYASQQARSC